MRITAAIALASMLGATAASSAAPDQRSPRQSVASRSLMSGILTAPSTQTPDEIARAFVERAIADLELAPNELVVKVVHNSGSATIVKLEQRHGGLRVVGGDAVVRLDRHGRVRWARVSPVTLNSSLSLAPSVPARDALARAVGTTSSDLVLDETRHTELVIYAGPGVTDPVLAWHTRHSDDATHSTWRTYVDAHTGAMIARDNLTHHATAHRAKVFPVNPVLSDDVPEIVTFDDIPEGSTTLADDEVRVLNCVDERQCHSVKTVAGIRDVHYCELVPTAATNTDGNFLDIDRPDDDTAPQDAFAEVQGYFHSKKALNRFRDWLGDPGFRLANPLTTIVNMRVPDLTSEVSVCTGDRAKSGSELAPEDNAYFWPSGEMGPVHIGDRIVLFQGTITDWAYDGEVVYHEMVHALMSTTTKLGWFIPDQLGINPAPGGLHEGFCDYLAGAITGNAEMNLYAGDEGEGPKPMLNLDQVKRCGDVLSGEEHDESVPWSTALWAIRKSLRSGAKRDMFNRAIMRALMGIGQFDGFERARELVLAELDIATEEFIDEHGLDSSEAGALRDIVATAPEKFNVRELPDCNSRIKALVPGNVKDGLYLRGPIALGFETFEGQLVPGPMQFELVIPVDTTAIKIVIDESFSYSDELKGPRMPELPEMQLLLKAGNNPIEWTWNLPTGSHDADHTAAVEIIESEFGTAEGVIEGDFPAGTYHLQLANRGADWNLANISFLISDEDGNFTDGKTDDLGGAADQSGCNAGRSNVPASALLWVLVGLAVIRRRRR